MRAIRDERDWVEHLERRLRQLRAGRQVLLELLRQCELRRAREVAALEARVQGLAREVWRLRRQLSRAQQELARYRGGAPHGVGAASEGGGVAQAGSGPAV